MTPRGFCGRCNVPFTCQAICARTLERLTPEAERIAESVACREIEAHRRRQVMREHIEQAVTDLFDDLFIRESRVCESPDDDAAVELCERIITVRIEQAVSRSLTVQRSRLRELVSSMLTEPSYKNADVQVGYIEACSSILNSLDEWR